MSYTHLISITKKNTFLQIKEWLDIALVSASYDIPTAIFIDANIISLLKRYPAVELEQVFNMLSDFSVPIFSQQTEELYGQSLTASPLFSLCAISKHHLAF